MKEEMIRFCLWWVMDSASYTESWEEIAVPSLSRWSLDETSVLDRVQIIEVCLQIQQREALGLSRKVAGAKDNQWLGVMATDDQMLKGYSVDIHVDTWQKVQMGSGPV